MDRMSPDALSGYSVATQAVVDRIWVYGLNAAIHHARLFLNVFEGQMRERQLEEYESGEYRCYADFLSRHTSREFKSSVHMDEAEQGITLDRAGAIC